MTTGFEAGTRDGRVVLIVSVAGPGAGGVAAAGLPMTPDDAKALASAVGGAIRELAGVRA